MNRSVHALVENTCSLPACQLLVGRTGWICNVNSFTRLFIGRQRANHVGEGELLVKRQPLTAFKWISYSDRTERHNKNVGSSGAANNRFLTSEDSNESQKQFSTLRWEHQIRPWSYNFMLIYFTTTLAVEAKMENDSILLWGGVGWTVYPL